MEKDPGFAREYSILPFDSLVGFPEQMRLGPDTNGDLEPGILIGTCLGEMEETD
jgi:hypothetical protein